MSECLYGIKKYRFNGDSKFSYERTFVSTLNLIAKRYLFLIGTSPAREGAVSQINQFSPSDETFLKKNSIVCVPRKTKSVKLKLANLSI